MTPQMVREMEYSIQRYRAEMEEIDARRKILRGKLIAMLMRVDRDSIRDKWKTEEAFGLSVMERAAVEFNVSLAALMERGNGRRLVWARHVSSHVLREAGWSLTKIAKLMRKHHTTILNSLRVMNEAKEDDNLKTVLARVQA